MIGEKLARLRSHRNNIARYRRLLKTKLTNLDRQFIERRLSVAAGFRALGAVGFGLWILIAGLSSSAPAVLWALAAVIPIASDS